MSAGHARYALGVLFTVNLFNYVDRQILSGVLPLVQQDLRLSDAALGALASAFMILYLLGAIPLGILGDRVARPRLIAVGVAVWGTATFLSGLARTYGQLFGTRALVGVGEASYGPTATAIGQVSRQTRATIAPGITSNNSAISTPNPKLTGLVWLPR